MAHELGRAFSAGQVENLAQLLTLLDQRLKSRPSLREAYLAFQSYRVIGSPLEPFRVSDARGILDVRRSSERELRQAAAAR